MCDLSIQPAVAVWHPIKAWISLILGFGQLELGRGGVRAHLRFTSRRDIHMQAGSNLRDPHPTLSISGPQKPSKIQETPHITTTVPSRVSLTIKSPVFILTNCTSSLAGKKDHIYCSSVKIYSYYKHFTTSRLPLSDLFKRDERNSKEEKERHVIRYQVS